MNSDLIKALEQLAEPISVPTGTVLFRCGDPVSAVFFVRKGRVVLEWPVCDRPIQLESRGPGSIVGLPAALNGSYSLSARALEDSELDLVTASRLLDLLETDGRLCVAAMKLVSQELSSVRAQIALQSWPQMGDNPDTAAAQSPGG